MAIQFKKITGFIIGMSISITAVAQQNNLTDRLKTASSRVNELVQANADYMSQSDQREVLELLRQVRDKVKPDAGTQPGQPSPYPGQPNNPGQAIKETQTTGLVSRKSNGDWITIRLNNPVVLSQISLRAVGSSKVRIYKILAVNLNNQATDLNITTDIAAGNSPGYGLPNTGIVVGHIQILAEAWSSDMSLVVSTVGDQQGQNNGPKPPSQQPPQYPGTPNYPDNGVSLFGYCEDNDHTQFKLAKDFAYSTSGLNYSSQQAVNWGLQYNQTHACNTMNEYKSRFAAIREFAYSTSGLNMSSADAVQFALSKVEYTTSAMAANMRSKLLAIKNFAYSTSGLNLSSTESAVIARSWIDRNNCEDKEGVDILADRYKKEYNFAYSTGGLNYSTAQAREYALNKIRPLSRCGDLLR